MLKKLKRWLMTDENREKYDLAEAQKVRDKQRQDMNAPEPIPPKEKNSKKSKKQLKENKDTSLSPPTPIVENPPKQRVVKRVVKRSDTLTDAPTSTPPPNTTNEATDDLHERLRLVQEQRELRKQGIITSATDTDDAHDTPIEDATDIILPTPSPTPSPSPIPSLSEIVAYAAENLDDTDDELILERKKEQDKEKQQALFNKKQEEREKYEDIFLDLPPTNDIAKLIAAALAQGVPEWYLLEAGYIDTVAPATLTVEKDYVQTLEKNLEESVDTLTTSIEQELETIVSDSVDATEKSIAYQVAAETVKESLKEKTTKVKEELELLETTALLEKNVPLESVTITDSPEEKIDKAQENHSLETVAIDDSNEFFTYDIAKDTTTSTATDTDKPQKETIVFDIDDTISQPIMSPENVAIDDDTDSVDTLSETDAVDTVEIVSSEDDETLDTTRTVEDETISLRIAQLRATMTAYQNAHDKIDDVIEKNSEELITETATVDSDNHATPLESPTELPDDLKEKRNDIAEKIRAKLNKQSVDLLVHQTVDTTVNKATSLSNFGNVEREVLTVFTSDEIFVKESVVTEDNTTHTTYCRYKLLNRNTTELQVGDILDSDIELKLVVQNETIIDGEVYDLTAAEEMQLEKREIWLLTTDTALLESAKTELAGTRYSVNIPQTERDFLLAIRNTSNLLVFTQNLPPNLKQSISKYIQYLSSEKKKARIVTIKTSIVKAGIIEKILSELTIAELDTYYTEYPKSHYHKNNKALSDIYKGISFDISGNKDAITIDVTDDDTVRTGFESLGTADDKVIVDFSPETNSTKDIPPTVDLSLQDAIQVDDMEDSLY